ncbi:MAG: hypothetical protein NDJ18_04470 [candidate division Zixibacteria bacterium]|nr:hypothetical protein [candidate division Zixibacteria bacterium]
MKALISLAEAAIIAGCLLLLFCWGTVTVDESGGALFLVMGIGILGALALIIGVVVGLVPLIVSPKSFTRISLLIWGGGVIVIGVIAYWIVTT